MTEHISKITKVEGYVITLTEVENETNTITVTSKKNPPEGLLNQYVFLYFDEADSSYQCITMEGPKALAQELGAVGLGFEIEDYHEVSDPLPKDRDKRRYEATNLAQWLRTPYWYSEHTSTPCACVGLL